MKNIINDLLKLFLVSVIFSMAVVQVVILNFHSTAGEKLVSYNETIKEVEEEIIRMNQKIASASALTTISTKAKNYGFVNNQQVISLTTPLPLAFFQKSSP